MKNKDKEAIKLKAQRAAFATFKQYGLARVKQNFPDQLDFVLENQHRPYEEVACIIYNSFLDLK